MKLHKWDDIKRSRNDPARAERIARRVEEELVQLSLADLRRELGVTQVEMAKAAEMTQSELSKLERRDDYLVSTLRRAVRALGGEIEVTAVVGGRRVKIVPAAGHLTIAAEASSHRRAPRFAAAATGGGSMSKAKGAGGGGSKGGGGRGGGVHTTKNPDGGGWANQVGGDVVSTHRTKEPAVEKGRKIAIEKKTEHVIHNGDRRIAQKKNSYRKDPNPPKDKK